MKKSLLIPALGLSALLASSVVAAESPWYVGVGVGQVDTGLSASDLSPLDDGSDFTNITTDAKDTAFSIYGGYQIDPNFSVEFGYINMGSYSADATSDGSGTAFNAGNIDIDVDLTAFNLGMKGMLPIANNFAGYGKLGFTRWDADFSAANGALSASASDDGTDLYYGVGASYDIGNVRFLAEFVRYAVDDIDADVIAAGIEYKF
jgi:OOP family OmpA-OmpF porin